MALLDNELGESYRQAWDQQLRSGKALAETRRIGLGDRVESALSAVGITKDRVERWLGKKCGCAERKKKLNQLGTWAESVARSGAEAARSTINNLLGRTPDMTPTPTEPALQPSPGPLLTIGFAAFQGYDWALATLQNLRLNHDLADCELLVVDNDGDKDLKAFCDAKGVRCVLATEIRGTAYPRERLFREAKGRFVLCMDAHVLPFAGTIARLKDYLRANADTKDLLSGPVETGNDYFETHFQDLWGGGMWGVWGSDPRAKGKEPFEIWAMGLGLFCMRREAWPGFNAAFRGFGAEEVYIHEKARRFGGKCLCLPWLKWWHFFRPPGYRVPYRLATEDKFRNYLIGHRELELDIAPVVKHFATLGMSPARMDAILEEIHEPARAAG